MKNEGEPGLLRACGVAQARGLQLALVQHTSAAVASEVRELIMLMSESSGSGDAGGKWFTDGVADDTVRDLQFHKLLTLRADGQLVAFLSFTSLEGEILLTLMATHPGFHRRGHGTILIDALCEYGRSLGFGRVSLFTVPPESKPQYAATHAFYRSRGFVHERRVEGLWGSGALRLSKDLGRRIAMLPDEAT